MLTATLGMLSTCCPARCKKSVYVGETERAVKQRVKEHLWDIRGNKDKPVAIHFNQGDTKMT